METFKTKSKVKNNHKVQIDDVPFDDGQEVEITITLENRRTEDAQLMVSLKGSVLKYDDPFESAISPEDRELLK